MRSLLALFATIWLLLSAQSARSQPDQSLRMRIIPVTADSIALDTLSLAPYPPLVYSMNGEVVDSALYDFDPVRSLFWWKKIPDLDSVKVVYRLLAIDFDRVYFHKSDTLINDYPTIIHNPFLVKENPASVLDFGNMAYNGSFARGVSFGNAQNLVLNSSFNLQLNGELSDGIFMRAALTDNNIPIQPEGNTQQIRDFDRVFIEFSKNGNLLKMGDFYLSGRPAHFLNYNKNLQGAGIKFQLKTDSLRTLKSESNAAVSKGAFARNVFNGREGDQGPYRLQSKAGGNFLIVIAGTERVWIDGKPLKRGSEYDYTIDYNSGEITFTPNQLITKDKRIVVEFEYAVQNYFRSLVQNSSELEGRHSRWRFNLYSEQDARNQPLFEAPDSLQIAVLTGIGDSIDRAVVPGYENVGYDPEEVRYERKDSLINGVLYSPVFVYSSDPEKATWQVRFSYIGPGKGDYEISGSNVNGRVYEWRAPENGIKQGSYEPVIRLVPPQKLQTLAFSHEFKLKRGQKFRSEIAVSNKDLNTFSSLDDRDDKGMAAFLEWDQILYEKKDSTNSRSLRFGGNYEFTARNFSPVTNYRAVEFARDWNIPNELPPAAQHLGEATLQWSDSRWGAVSYGSQAFLSGKSYQGVNQLFNIDYRKNNFEFGTRQRYLSSTSTDRLIHFYRPAMHLNWKTGNWTLGFRTELEDNRIANASDSLIANSFSFDESTAFISRNDTARLPLLLSYTLRRDRLPLSGLLREANRGQTLKLSGRVKPAKRQVLEYTIGLRSLKVSDSLLSKEEGKESALGRIQYSATLLQGLLRGNILYESGSGQEQKREYVYLKVLEGQGNYIWNDDGDGIPEIGEFLPAGEADLPFANYVRIITPTAEFVPTQKSAFNLGLNVQPSALKNGGKFWKRWSNLTSLRISKQVLSMGGLNGYNPFDFRISDSALVSLNSGIRNTLYFNRSARSFGVVLTYLQNGSKQLLTFGSEERLLQSGNLLFRSNYGKNWESRLELESGINANRAANLENRNYAFRYQEIKPSVIYQSGSNFRLTLSGLWSDKKNEDRYGGELAKVGELSVEARYNLVNKNSLNMDFSYTSIAYDGALNTPLAYAMLNGLNRGNNYQWNLRYDHRLANNVELGIQYIGQKRGNSAVRHTGSMQMRALF